MVPGWIAAILLAIVVLQHSLVFALPIFFDYFTRPYQLLWPALSKSDSIFNDVCY
jgi:hypothetical protein